MHSPSDSTLLIGRLEQRRGGDGHGCDRVLVDDCCPAAENGARRSSCVFRRRSPTAHLSKLNECRGTRPSGRGFRTRSWPSTRLSTARFGQGSSRFPHEQRSSGRRNRPRRRRLWLASDAQDPSGISVVEIRRGRKNAAILEANRKCTASNIDGFDVRALRPPQMCELPSLHGFVRLDCVRRSNARDVLAPLIVFAEPPRSMKHELYFRRKLLTRKRARR
ncbi:hypothetical protein ENSA7_54700 [Enhygromyxa salina]|uniref:Uncharacterized protein n=1 Tax=Enhygromyxa salina TaxID=215803 RepID=A0A2S9YCB9_9BACT|nr:hypothetical protein ENSA7_54700 [Enhygromyxa salina]